DRRDRIARHARPAAAADEIASPPQPRDIAGPSHKQGAVRTELCPCDPAEVRDAPTAVLRIPDAVIEWTTHEDQETAVRAEHGSDVSVGIADPEPVEDRSALVDQADGPVRDSLEPARPIRAHESAALQRGGPAGRAPGKRGDLLVTVRDRHPRCFPRGLEGHGER